MIVILLLLLFLCWPTREAPKFVIKIKLQNPTISYTQSPYNVRCAQLITQNHSCNQEWETMTHQDYTLSFALGVILM